MYTTYLCFYYNVHMIHRHHLLEIILWPNDDGTFKLITNSEKRLKDLGVYKDYKLTIRLEHNIHRILHDMYPSDERLIAYKMNVAKMQQSNIGRVASIETRKKLSIAKTGMKFTDEHRHNLSISHKGLMRGYKHTTIARENMSKAQKGRIITQEHRDKLSDAKKGRRWYNNGVYSVQAFECPPGFKPGRIYKRKRAAK